MRLLIQKEDGSISELREVMSIGEGDIIIRVNQCCREVDIKAMEKKLSDKFDRKVIVLDAKYGEILTLPPEKNPGGRPQETVGVAFL